MKKTSTDKPTKTARIELRCTPDFKDILEKIALQKSIKLSELIESLCTVEVIKFLTTREHPLYEQKEIEPTYSPNFSVQLPPIIQPTTKHNTAAKDSYPFKLSTNRSTRDIQIMYGQRIIQMKAQGIGYIEMADKLNELGSCTTKGKEWDRQSVKNFYIRNLRS